MPAYPSHFTYWLEYVTGGKVDGRDCGEIIDELEIQESAQYTDSVNYPRLEDLVSLPYVQMYHEIRQIFTFFPDHPHPALTGTRISAHPLRWGTSALY